MFGPVWSTVYRRFAQWSRDRVWGRLYRVILDELGAWGEVDRSRCAIDSVIVRSRCRLRRRRPTKLHADEGYNYDHLRRWLRKRGIRHCIARKGIEPS